MKSGKQRRKPAFKKDKRRKHQHWQVTVALDGEKFVRVYTDRAKATNFAERQEKLRLSNRLASRRWGVNDFA